MCIAIFKPAAKHINKRELRDLWTSNPDGGGYMFAANGELYVDKGYFTFKAFYKEFRNAEAKFPKSDFVIHFRIATSGKISINHCHPFYVSNNLAFVHNGIFAFLSKDDTESDTMIFNKNILRKLPTDFMLNSASIDLLETYCDHYNSKLILLTHTGFHQIINESAGEWRNDIWYSNKSIVVIKGFSSVYDREYVYTSYPANVTGNAIKDWDFVNCSSCKCKVYKCETVRTLCDEVVCLDCAEYMQEIENLPS